MPQRVGHDRAGCAPPAGGVDPLLPREAREVGHDQEVAAVPHPIDDPQLVVEPVADLIGQAWAVSVHQPALALLAQPGAGGLALGHREMRQAELVELQLQVHLLGHAHGVVHGLAQLPAEEAAHLGRRLQEELVGLELQPARRVDVGGGPDAEQQVVRVVLLRHRVVRVIGGQQRDLHVARQLHQLRMQAVLLRDAVVLHLDVEVLRTQDGPIVVGGLPGCPLVAFSQAPEHFPAEAGGLCR